MEGKITGLVIDQTRTQGKWYVRELDDGNGGVRPLFFRRETSDLIGRLIDKFTHVESAQRYAARHMTDLGFSSADSVTDVYAAPGKLKPITTEQKKLAGERLQALLAGKAAQATAARAGCVSHDLQNDAASSPPVTVIRHPSAPKEPLQSLWNACKHHRFTDKHDKAARKDFEHLMGQALRLQRGELASNDPKVWRECMDFIRHLDNAGDSAWENDAARQKFGQLRDYFFPAAPAPSQMNAEAVAIEAGKMGFALERLCYAGASALRPELADDVRRSVAHLFQICLEEQSTAPALETVYLPWSQLTTSQDVAALNGLQDLATSLRGFARHDDRVLLDKTIAAIGKRLARIEHT